MKNRRRISAPFLYRDSKLYRNCIIEYCNESKKIVYIAVDVEDIDSQQSVEYYNGILTAEWKSWRSDMNSIEISKLINSYCTSDIIDLLNKAITSHLDIEYSSSILLLENINYTNFSTKENSNIKIIVKI